MTNHKKIQTTIRPDSTTSVRELGWVRSENLDRDIGEERERFAKVALAGRRAMVAQAAIQAVEVAGQTIVAIYENGTVRVINYVPEKEKP